MPKEFSMIRRIQFAETDAAGVLHFANYARFMEEVEHAYWRSLGLSVIAKGEDYNISWPRVVVHCEYFEPVAFEDEVELLFRVTHVGAKSLSYEVEFRCGDRRRALGKMTVVCCQLDDGSFRSVSIPDDIRAKLES